jgi:nucleotidyltransferase/DNA polymerase involved in DNA repair
MSAPAPGRRCSPSTRPAARTGIHPGMSAVQALARCPELTTLDRQPDHERALASQLRELARTLAPRLEAAAPDSLLLDVPPPCPPPATIRPPG